MKVSKTKVNKTKVKRISKKKKPAAVKKKAPAKAAAPSVLVENPSTPENTLAGGMTPYAALADEFALANAWDVLGDEEYILDDEVWNTLYNRIKLQLLQTTYSFRVETDGAALTPYAVTPMPAFRSENEPGFLAAGSFTILRPDVPGVVFDLKISTSDQALLLDWTLTRRDMKPNLGHVALYLDGELVEAVNLQQNRCQLELTRDDMGEATFYFLDAESGKQAKILELSV